MVPRSSFPRSSSWSRKYCLSRIQCSGEPGSSKPDAPNKISSTLADLDAILGIEEEEEEAAQEESPGKNAEVALCD